MSAPRWPVQILPLHGVTGLRFGIGRDAVRARWGAPETAYSEWHVGPCDREEATEHWEYDGGDVWLSFEIGEAGRLSDVRLPARRARWGRLALDELPRWKLIDELERRRLGWSYFHDEMCLTVDDLNLMVWFDGLEFDAEVDAVCVGTGWATPDERRWPTAGPG